MLKYLHVSKADAGEISVFDSRDKFAAGFVHGQWVLGHDFDDYALEERFNLVLGDDEALRILADARSALNKPLLSDQEVKST